MKKTCVKIKGKILFGILCILLGVSCTKDPQPDSVNRSKDQSAVIDFLEMSYEVEATTRYIYNINDDFSDLDIASMIPTRTKSAVKMIVNTRGELSMEIDDIPVEQPVEILHKSLPDDSPKIKRTVISNGTATFFTDGNKVLSTATVELPNQFNLVQRISDAGKCISSEDINYVLATMQGQMFAENLEEFIQNAQRDGSQVEELDEQHVSIRIPLSRVNPNSDYETVLLMDKVNNRFLGSIIYNGLGDEVLSTMLGYGPPSDPTLRAIRQLTRELLPSGKGVKVETITRIEKLNLKVNL